MSIWQGVDCISGNGATPYINPSTGNWEINGVDSGFQAVPIKVTLEQYNELKNANALNNRYFFITDNIPTTYSGINIPVNSWVNNGKYYKATIPVANITTKHAISVGLSSQLTDDEYINQYYATQETPFLRIYSSEGNIHILAEKQPEIAFKIDITAIPCV